MPPNLPTRSVEQRVARLEEYIARSLGGERELQDLDTAVSENSMFTHSPGIRTKRVAPTVITRFQSGHGFFASGAGSVTVNDSSAFCLDQTQCMKITSDGAGGSCLAKLNSAGPFNLTGKYVRVWVRFPTASDINNVSSLSINVSSDNNVSNFWAVEFGNLQTYPNWITAENDWCAVTIPWGAFTVTGAPTRSAINSIWLKVIDQNSQVVNVQFGGIEALAEPANGVVSFAFDDGLATQWSNARWKLSQYGFPATAYVIRNGIDSTAVNGDGVGYMTLSQLKTLQDRYGWEIAAHADTITGHNTTNGFTGLSATACEKEIVGIRNWLQQNGFNGANHLALPQGFHNSTTNDICRRLHLSTRTTYHPMKSETWPPADYNKLRIFYVLNNTSTASIATAVTRALNNKEWLILLFHDITSGAASSSNQYTTTNFNTVVDDINTQGIAVRAVGDVVQNGI